MNRPLPHAFGRTGRIAALLAGLALVGMLPGIAVAAAPANDLPADAVAITTSPTSFTLDTTEATVTTDDVGCGRGGFDQATVWYTLSFAATTSVLIDATGSDYLVGVNVFVDVPDSNHIIDCRVGTVPVSAEAGTTYYLMFADVDGDVTNGGQLHVEIGPPPPAMDLTLTVDSVGKVDPKTGQAAITGTVTCTTSAVFANVSVSLRQPIGRFVIHGFGFDSPACGPTPTAWFASIVGDNGKFTGGHATAQVNAFACDPFSCDEAFVNATVRLGR